MFLNGIKQSQTSIGLEKVHLAYKVYQIISMPLFCCRHSV
uniref:Uncharacterized protein n=1 Tax=Arundo donax TaxID=35708 RepID=A0A0A9BKV8_ARUDO